MMQKFGIDGLVDYGTVAPDETKTVVNPAYRAETALAHRLRQHLANPLSDRALRCLAAQLNESQTVYPGTNLRLVFKLVSDENP